MGRGRGPNAADSYIGSLISLTSKSEIRYEGILYTVDTENSNIALQNVRSFGTEGRKKDGPQIPASDKVYDYIIFRGSDIKDLQVKSSPPPPLQPPPLPSQPTDPAIVSLQSQLQYPPPSYLGSYNGGAPAAGSSSEPSAPPPPYMGVLPSQYRGAMSPLYPSAGLQSWGPPPPPPGANGAGLGMPMYWQGFSRPLPAGHMQQQSIHPQPPSLTAPSQGGQQQQGPSLLAPLPALAVSRPRGLVTGPSSSGAAGSGSQPQAATSVSGVLAASAASSGAPVAPLMAASTAPASSTVTSAILTQNTQNRAASPVASFSGTSTFGSGLGVPVSATSSLPSSIQGVSAVITPMCGDPRRGVGMVSQAAPASSVQDWGSSSQGLHTQSIPSAAGVISGSLVRPHGEAAQSSGTTDTKTKPGAAGAQEQASAKVEQEAMEPANAARSGVMQASSHGTPAQEQASQPLLPLPSAELTQQEVAQRRSHGVSVGQRNRWQGNVYTGNGNYNRRGRGRRSGSGRGVGVTHPTQQFTEDFDFTAMNEKFKKDEVWGTLGGNGESAGDDEEFDYDDGHADDDIADHVEADASKKALYNKDDFFDSLSCDTLGREGGRGERTTFSEQRKIDTETFGALPVRCRGGRGFRGGRRGGYRTGYYGGGGGGSHWIGRGGGYGRGRGMGQPSHAIL